MLAAQTHFAKGLLPPLSENISKPYFGNDRKNEFIEHELATLFLSLNDIWNGYGAWAMWRKGYPESSCLVSASKRVTPIVEDKGIVSRVNEINGYPELFCKRFSQKVHFVSNFPVFDNHPLLLVNFLKRGLTTVYAPLQHPHGDLKNTNENQQASKPFEPHLYAHIFIGFFFIFAQCLGHAVRGRHPLYGWCIVLIGCFGLLIDLSALGFGNAFTFWRFRWLLGNYEDEECYRNQAFHFLEETRRPARETYSPNYRKSTDKLLTFYRAALRR
jgi:hypothetical protein